MTRSIIRGYVYVCHASPSISHSPAYTYVLSAPARFPSPKRYSQEASLSIRPLQQRKPTNDPEKRRKKKKK